MTQKLYKILTCTCIIIYSSLLLRQSTEQISNYWSVSGCKAIFLFEFQISLEVGCQGPNGCSNSSHCKNGQDNAPEPAAKFFKCHEVGSVWAKVVNSRNYTTVDVADFTLLRLLTLHVHYCGCWLNTNPSIRHDNFPQGNHPIQPIFRWPFWCIFP